MRLKRVRLQNIRTFVKAEISDLPDVVLFVSPNGIGKSTMLEAIIGAHELVSPYLQQNYPYTENIKGNNVRVWPRHLRDPVTVGKPRGVIDIEVEPSVDEAALLSAAGIEGKVGTAQFVLDAPRYVVDSQQNDVLKRLFEFHRPTEGFGYIDYTRPIRVYPNLTVGNITDTGTEAKVRNVFADFHRGPGDAAKFFDFKTFVVTSMLNDVTTANETGKKVDSLEVFKTVFNRFFAPKRFLGPKLPAPGAPIEMLVRTALGSHDTDGLSDGEKEILLVLAHLFQYRHLANVVLWDTPEANLNARLEARLFDALTQIAPKNQYLLATHGLELIESVPIDSVFAIRDGPEGAKVERLREGSNRARIYRELGAGVGLQTVSTVMIFVEGKEASSDKRHLTRLLRGALPSANLVAGGDCDTILGVGTRANQLLDEASTNGDFLAIVDRDYRDDDAVRSLEDKYRGQLFVWQVHELENLFLEPSLVFQVLEHADKLGTLKSPDDVKTALRNAASSLADWIAADWERWEISNSLTRPTGRIETSDPLQSLRDYAQRVAETRDPPATSGSVEDRFKARRTEVDRLLKTTLWSIRLPGKQIIERFLKTAAPSLTPQEFLASAVGFMSKAETMHPEVRRLIDVVETKVEAVVSARR